MRFPARRSGSSVAVALSVAAAALASLTVAACGDAPTRSAERFCGELTAHLPEIQTGPTSADAIPAFIVLFSKMGEVAPLEVQEDWEAVYTSLKTANTVEPNDPASSQAVADSAIAQQQAYVNVAAWAKKTCDLDIGPVGSVAGGADIATTTTAAPGPETTISGG